MGLPVWLQYIGIAVFELIGGQCHWVMRLIFYLNEGCYIVRDMARSSSIVLVAILILYYPSTASRIFDPVGGDGYLYIFKVIQAYVCGHHHSLIIRATNDRL